MSMSLLCNDKPERNMTDKELLEAAARAAGIEYEIDEDGDVYMHQPEQRPWNPLADDGDALRLAVKLSLVVWDWEQYQKAMAEVRHGAARGEYWEDVGTDPCAATRRAIVRAAAAIGSLHNAM
jgi:hypothetical protein